MSIEQKTTMKVLIVAVLLCLLSLGITPSARADDNMIFHGALLEHPPCEINDGQPVEIDFGSVGVNRVNGQNYAKTFKIPQALAFNQQGAAREIISGTNIIALQAYVRGEPEAVNSRNIGRCSFSAIATFNLEYEYGWL